MSDTTIALLVGSGWLTAFLLMTLAYVRMARRGQKRLDEAYLQHLRDCTAIWKAAGARQARKRSQ